MLILMFNFFQYIQIEVYVSTFFWLVSICEILSSLQPWVNIPFQCWGVNKKASSFLHNSLLSLSSNLNSVSLRTDIWCFSLTTTKHTIQHTQTLPFLGLYNSKSERVPCFITLTKDQQLTWDFLVPCLIKLSFLCYTLQMTPLWNILLPFGSWLCSFLPTPPTSKSKLYHQ